MVDIATAVQEARTVRKARADEAPRLAAALGLAFEDDPAATWIVPDDAQRRTLLERAFLLFLERIWLEQEECYTTQSGAGAAVWELPGQWKLGLGLQLRLLPRLALTYRRFTPRLVRAIDALESDHPSQEHYYLPFVGVIPDWQGRGIGAALIKPVLDRCDRERLPAYLEASAPRNRALYERHGFEVTEEFRLGKGSPPLWRMWRAPAAPDAP
jgi:GNAT superfamily N-acetyltransferase